MRESEATQHNALHDLPGFGTAFEADHLGERGGDGLDAGKLLAGERQVVERSRDGVEIPFSRLVQEFKRPFRIIEVACLQPEDSTLAETDNALLFVHANDRQPRLHPLGHCKHFGVGNRIRRL